MHTYFRQGPAAGAWALRFDLQAFERGSAPPVYHVSREAAEKIRTELAPRYAAQVLGVWRRDGRRDD